MTFEEAWDLMLELDIVSEETMRVVTNINGDTVEALDDIVWTETGYRTLEDYAKEVLPWWDKPDEDELTDEDKKAIDEDALNSCFSQLDYE